MKIYLANWPDGTQSVLTAKTHNELLLKLNAECAPFLAKVFELPCNFQLVQNRPSSKLSLDYGKMKPVKLLV